MNEQHDIRRHEMAVVLIEQKADLRDKKACFLTLITSARFRLLEIDRELDAAVHAARTIQAQFGSTFTPRVIDGGRK